MASGQRDELFPMGGQEPAGATTIAMLVTPNIPEFEAERRDMKAAAQAIGQQLVVIDIDGQNVTVEHRHADNQFA